MVDLLSDKVEENLALARDVQSKLKEVRRAMVDSLRLIDESIQRAPNGPGELGFDLSHEADGSTWAVFPNGQRVMLEPAGGGDERAAEVAVSPIVPIGNAADAADMADATEHLPTLEDAHDQGNEDAAVHADLPSAANEGPEEPGVAQSG